MSRNYSSFFPLTAKEQLAKSAPSPLERLGWKSFFSQQVSIEELSQTPPVRVTEVHRTGLRLLGDGIDTLIPPVVNATVGDWMLLDQQTPSHSKILQRSSAFERRAPGQDRKRQLIAANVDTAFIVSSCNHDFNIARLERYIALAFEANVTAVILLTKTDTCNDPVRYITAASSISDRVLVEALNALGEEPKSKLAPWCFHGQTIAFLGSSGVGKSTLVNALFHDSVADTAGVRENDSKGRHTTTRRHLHFAANGCAILDTPGMRELQLTNVETGIAELFDDLIEISSRCRFKNCRHETEPGCAIRLGIDRGEIEASRLARWRKLVAEDLFNSSTLAERRIFDKKRTKMHRSILFKTKW